MLIFVDQQFYLCVPLSLSELLTSSKDTYNERLIRYGQSRKKASKSSPNKDGTEDHNPKDGAGAKEIPKVEADKPEHYGPESSKSNKKEKKKSSCMGCFPYCGGGEEEED